MQIEWLREFVVFSRFLNITKVAKYLNMSQPTLSKHLLSLESWSGLSLINRSDPMSLTRSGVQFLDVAQRTLKVLDNGLQACKKSLNERPPLKIEGFDFDFNLFPLHEFAQFGSFEFVQTRGSDKNEPYFEGLLKEATDILYTADFTKLPKLNAKAALRNLEALPLDKARGAIAMSVHHPLAQKEKLTASDFDKREFLIIEPAYLEVWQELIPFVLGKQYTYSFTMKPLHGNITNASQIGFEDELFFFTADELECLFGRRTDVIIIKEIDGKPILIPRGILYRKDDENPLVQQFVQGLQGYVAQN